MSAPSFKITEAPPPGQKAADDLIARMTDSFTTLAHIHLTGQTPELIDTGLHLLNALCNVFDRADPETERALIEVMRGHVVHFDQLATSLETATPAGAA